MSSKLQQVILGGLAGILVLGVIAEVLIQIVLGQKPSVDPTLASLAGVAITTLFGHTVVTSQMQASGVQRTDFLALLEPVVRSAVAAPPPPTTTSPSTGTTTAGPGSGAPSAPWTPPYPPAGGSSSG